MIIKVAHLHVVTYNALPARHRRTIDGVRYAWINGAWHVVKLVRRPNGVPKAAAL